MSKTLTVNPDVLELKLEELTKIHVVTFSGFSGTGKTTLAGEVKKKLESDGAKVLVIESVASQVFAEYTAKHSDILTYRDLDEKGRRLDFQYELLRALKKSIKDLTYNLAYKRIPVRNVYILIDRWFFDIDCFTRCEVFPGEEADKFSATALEYIEEATSRLLMLSLALGCQGLMTHVWCRVSGGYFAAMESKASRAPESRISNWESFMLSYSKDNPHFIEIIQPVLSERTATLFDRITMPVLIR